MAHLSGRRVNLQLLRQLGRKEFSSCFEEINGTICIGWCDDALRDALNLIVDMPYLQEINVIKMFVAEKGAIVPNIAPNVVFITKPNLDSIQLICEVILRTKENDRSSDHVKYHLMFVPRRCFLCEERLKEMGVFETVKDRIYECAIDFYPLDNDFFSMELPECFREYCLEDDTSSLFVAARGLNCLQNMFGTIPRVYGKGKAAELVFQYMARMRGETSTGNAAISEVTPVFDNLLLIDRSVDLLSLLPTQLTYEGLLDETVRIRSTAAKFPATIFKSEDRQTQQPLSETVEMKKIFLSSADPMYIETRDKDYRLVGPHLVKKLDTIKETYQKHKQKDTSMAELKLFTSNLPHLIAEKENVSKHTAIATLLKDKSQTMDFKEQIRQEQNLLFMDSSIIGSSGPVDLDKINPFVETSIAKQEPITKVLRLICLQSVLNNGLKQKVLDFYKREIIQTYGYQYLTTLLNLEKAGLIGSPTARTMPSIKKTLKLIDMEFDFRSPNDIIFSVFDGYAPLSVRLGQFIRTPGWRSIEEILKVLPGPKIDERQEVPTALRKKLEDPTVASTFMNADNPQLTLVFFIGGVTFAEVSTFRCLSANDENGAEFVVGTTAVVNGNSFIEALMDDYSHAFDTTELTSYSQKSQRKR